MRVAVDTSLGLEFVDLLYGGTGILIDERIREKCAEKLRLPFDEVYEIVRVDFDLA